LISEISCINEWYWSAAAMALFMQRHELENRGEEKAMALPHITPRRAATYILSGASGIHILMRIWHLRRSSARTLSLRHFLPKCSDIILPLCRSPLVLWHLAKHYHQRRAGSRPIANASEGTLLPRTTHQLRQDFTALRLGLDLIKRKETSGKTNEIPRLVKRLQDVVTEGIQALNVLDPPYYETPRMT
jgi:hypothetical protein